MKIVDDFKKLSDSKLWQFQEDAYHEFGPNAWTSQGVPFYITSCPLTVKKYLAVTIGYIRDLIKQRQINLQEPLYIFDLGAGSGRFAYLFMKYLLEAIHQIFDDQLQIRYIMTDIVRENILFWENHPPLKPYIDKKILDFAYYKHNQKEPIKLHFSNKELHDLKNPAVVIGNYFFDTIPQDFFRVSQGSLQEGKIALKSDHQDIDPKSHRVIEHLECDYQYKEIAHPENYYIDHPDFNQVLVEYKRNFENLPLLFPLGALEVLHYFEHLTQKRMLLLVGDQGLTTIKQMQEITAPSIHKHATFSMPVCYHIIKTYIEQKNGKGFLTSHSDTTFVVMAAVINPNAQMFKETAYAFKEHIDSFEPKDYWFLVEETAEHTKECSLEHMLTLIKLGHWDPVNFHTFFPHMHAKIASTKNRADLSDIVDDLYEQFYPLSKEEGAFLVNLGVVCFESNKFKKALFYFQKALELMGESALILKNISACYAKMGMHIDALKFLEKAENLSQ